MKLNECIDCRYQCEDNDGYGVQFVCHRNGQRKNVELDGTCEYFEPNEVETDAECR